MDNLIYFLDRSVIIGYLNGESRVKRQLFDFEKHPRCYISIATLSNLYEIYLDEVYQDRRKLIGELATQFRVVDFELTDFDELAKIRSELGNNWQKVSFWDLLFAAHVRAHRAIMVTTTGKGARFPDIKKLVDESWGSEEQVVLEFTGVTGNERGVMYKIAKTISDLGISISNVAASTKFNYDNHKDKHRLELVLDLTDWSSQDVLNIKTKIRYAMNYTVKIKIDDSRPHRTGSGDPQNQQFVCTFIDQSSRTEEIPADESTWTYIKIEITNRVGLLSDITHILYENKIDIIEATTNKIDIIEATTSVPSGGRPERFILSFTLRSEITTSSDDLFTEICKKVRQIPQVEYCDKWLET